MIRALLNGIKERLEISGWAVGEAVDGRDTMSAEKEAAIRIASVSPLATVKAPRAAALVTVRILIDGRVRRANGAPELREFDRADALEEVLKAVLVLTDDPAGGNHEFVGSDSKEGPEYVGFDAVFDLKIHINLMR